MIKFIKLEWDQEIKIVLVVKKIYKDLHQYRDQLLELEDY